VTGTPPYFPPSAALDAEDEQRAYARIEYRGGVEAYIAAGAAVMSHAGRLVLCTDARITQRTTSACEAAGLSIAERWDVVPRAGKPALFSVWTLCHARTPMRLHSLTLRSETGASTSDARMLREFCGFD
jgi:tRNA1Val (adenine37-N6)-methyltransferase